MKENPYPYFKQIDCLVMTSNYEGFPVVYLEALILHKQLLTTIPISTSNFDVEDYGFVCSRDIQEISKMMVYVKENPKEYDFNINSINADNLKKVELLLGFDK